MADNPTIDNGSLTDVPVVGDEIVSPYSGDTAVAQAVKLLGGAANGAEVIEGTTANGLEVDVTRVTGTVTVGDGGSTISVDDGAGSLTVDGTVAVSSIAAGDNNIGNVDVASLPALPAGTNNIGDVDVLTLPALPAGTNTVGSVKITDGTDVLAVAADGSIAVTGSFSSSATFTRIAVTPTISSAAIYAAKDAVGGLMTFANAAATSGAAVRIRGVEVIDKDQERAELELVLFAATLSSVTDNAVFDPTDAELADYVATIPISGGHYSDFNDNSVARVNCDILVTPSATSLFGVLVARATPTYTATTDLVVTLEIERP